MGRKILAAALVGHGLVHWLGFAVPWKLVSLPEMPYATTLLAGTLEVGALGVRGVGLLWLLAGLSFMAAGLGALAGKGWWVGLTLWTALLSLLLCVLGWPAARFGLLIDLAILTMLPTGNWVRPAPLSL